MSEKQKQMDAHNQAMSEFIQMANSMVNDKGFDMKLVSAAMMAASGVYATFTAAGNEGFLAEGGVDRVADMYKKNLAYIQKRKKEELESKGLTPKPMAVAGAGQPENPAETPNQS
ncbi:MAG TPA: hypothetical protein VKO38_05350 [Wenzhouxiangella sp.]|nr:hypothetical protein [Wenzhouxiangella sp.]